MQHLNYCRQALAQFSNENLNINAQFSPLCEEYAAWAGADNKIANKRVVARHMEQTIKFSLPKNGVIIEDKKYKAIKSLGELKLPFDEFILEFETERAQATSGQYLNPSKVIVIVSKFTGHDDTIGIVHVWYIPEAHGWVINPPIVIQTKAYDGSSGGLAVAAHDVESEALRLFYRLEFFAFGDIMKPVLNFLNAISCRNVHIEKSPAKSTKQGKKVKTAFPFDDYHFLTVDVPGKAGVRGEGLGGSHRSPREHLRRGHIRRLDSGPIWVNACVVNAGIGSKVGKSYLLRKSE